MTRLHNENLDALYSPHIIRVTKKKDIGEGRLWQVWGERICAYRVLVGINDGRRPLRRPRRRWEDNIKMVLQEEGVGVWTGSSWLRIGTGGGHL